VKFFDTETVVFYLHTYYFAVYGYMKTKADLSISRARWNDRERQLWSHQWLLWMRWGPAHSSLCGYHSKQSI